VNYLLDTNACIALINGEPIRVRRRLEKVLREEASVFVSSVVLFELWYGIEKSTRQQSNQNRLAVFLAGPVSTLPFDEADAEAAGRIRGQLERVGRPIGAYDLLIAGQALCRGHVLVTANSSEFSHVKTLRWEDWSKR
jgi:tRNA(fMet)-specific endonuclease VapC